MLRDQTVMCFLRLPEPGSAEMAKGGPKRATLNKYVNGYSWLRQIIYRLSLIVYRISCRRLM